MKKTIPLALTAMLISIAIFLYFKTFVADFPDYAKELSAGFLGAVITVIVTAVLLQSQTNNELSKEKTLGVFQAKLACYSGFIDFINDIVEDGVADRAELLTFRKWILRISLLSTVETESVLGEFYGQSHKYRVFEYDRLTDDQKAGYSAWYSHTHGEDPKCDDAGNPSFVTLGKVLSALKIDLGEENLSKVKEARIAGYLFDDFDLY